MFLDDSEPIGALVVGIGQNPDGLVTPALWAQRDERAAETGCTYDTKPVVAV